MFVCLFTEKEFMDIYSLPDRESFVAVLNRNPFSATKETLRTEVVTILFCNRGSAHLEIDFVMYDIVPHIQVILLPGIYLRCLYVSEDFACSYISFTRDLYDEVTSRLGPSFSHFLKEYPCVLLPRDKLRPLVSLVHVMVELYADYENCFRLEIAKNSIQSFLMNVYDKTRCHFRFQRSSKAGRQEELFLSFVHLVFEYGATERDVKFYADKLCITPRYLSSVMQQVIGENPKQLIDKHAVQEIKMMLKSGNCSMLEISTRLKFPDQSVMARYFKKHTGMSPVEYRYS